ncbi:MAG: PDZ domain-containing protein [Cyanothece sp. SIO1E1]|nr:PDZ domain-containing protein [Cyanothece sp. SIO1E1]
MNRNYYTTLWIVLLLSLPFNMNSQELARKGSLGALLGPVSLDIQSKTQAPSTKGTYLQRVIPNTTAASIGLKAGDIVLSINEEPIKNTQEAVQIAKTFVADQKVKVEVWRKGKRQTLSGRVKGKPIEQSPVAQIVYDAVPFEDGMLRSILHKPKADGHFPLVVFMQGFDCGSIDAYYDNAGPIRRMVDGLVEKGFAVYRVEKPGVGDSNGSLDCGSIDYDQELAAFDTALGELKKYKFIDHENIFYFGHSLGGITAPILAAKHHPKGVMVYGTVLKSWHEYMHEVHREQAIKRGDDFIRLDANTRAVAPLLAEFFLMKKSPAELAKNPDYLALMENGIMAFQDDRLFGRHYTFWQNLNDHNQAEAWKKAGVHTLALYGEYDLQAISAEAAENIAALVNAYHPGKGQYMIIPETEHAFARVPSMKEYLQMRNSGAFDRQYMTQNFNKDIVEIISEWMLNLLQES